MGSALPSHFLPPKKKNPLIFEIKKIWRSNICQISSSYSIILLLFSCVRLYETPWTVARQASLSITNSWSLLKLMSIESVLPSNHLHVCRPLLLLPSIFAASESFPMSWLFTSGGQSIGATVSVLPINIQC